MLRVLLNKRAMQSPLSSQRKPKDVRLCVFCEYHNAWFSVLNWLDGFAKLQLDNIAVFVEAIPLASSLAGMKPEASHAWNN